MKNIILLIMIIALSTGSCMQKEAKSPIEGAWKMTGFSWVSGDTITNYRVPGPEFESQIKMWTKNYWSFTGIGKTDTTDIDLFGCGTYTLTGTEYEETIIFHNDKASINTKYNSLLELRGDTLYQTAHPYDSTGKQMENYTSVEKYVRAE